MKGKIKKFFSELNLAGWIYVTIGIPACILMVILLCSCSTGKSFTEKPYICYEVFPTTNGKVVHRFANLSLTQGREFDMDSTCCQPMDTIVIKDYRRGPFCKKLTVFINYKN